MKKYIFISFLSIFTLALAGCQTTGLGGGQTITLPRYTKVDPKTIPASVQAISIAVTQRLRGVDAGKIEKSLAVKGSGLIAPSPGLALKTFALKHIQAVSMDKLKTPDGSRTRYTGRLLFQDVIGRREGIAFAVVYRTSGKSVILEKAAWQAIPSIEPKTEVLVVPAAAIAGKIKNAGASYRDLYRLAAENAVAMQDRSKTTEDKKDYIIFTFVKDHITAGSKFEVRLGNRKTGKEGYRDASRYLVYDKGWVVGVTPGHYSLGAGFWIKAVYTPGKDSGLEDLKERVVGLYFSRPNKVDH